MQPIDPSSCYTGHMAWKVNTGSYTHTSSCGQINTTYVFLKTSHRIERFRQTAPVGSSSHGTILSSQVSTIKRDHGSSLYLEHMKLETIWRSSCLGYNSSKSYCEICQKIKSCWPVLLMASSPLENRILTGRGVSSIPTLSNLRHLQVIKGLICTHLQVSHSHSIPEIHVFFCCRYTSL